MFESLQDLLRQTMSGVAAKRMVGDISRYHRIQASPDLRQAAQMVHEILLAWGLDAQLLSYPANETTRFWGMRMFQEWSGVAGTLRLISPADKARTLADYREQQLSLIPRSAPFEGEADVVLPRNEGHQPEDYDGLDVTGRIVITSGQVMRVHQLAVEQRGAVGIIFDGMRTLEPVAPEWSLPDAIQYTSFWWWNVPRKGFGFALTPRQGRWLRRLVETASPEEPVRVHARVVSRLYDGAIENVTATIPGDTQEEILLVAHLCHPAPCANDNASGASAAMEVAHALHTLIDAGNLTRPRRTLRFLWVPEMTGTYAFLTKASEAGTLSHIVAGLNLDMVGEDQEQCGSVLLIDRPPEASPSFTVDLLERIREELFGEGTSFSRRGHFPLFRYATVPFSGGSDHFIFSDPSVGVPMPMLIQWPDRFYHTTADTLERVSPESLSQACQLAGTYMYWLASAGPQEVDWLAREMLACYKRRIVGNLQEAVTGNLAPQSKPAHAGIPWREQLDYWIGRQQAAFTSLHRLEPDFDPRPWSRSAAYFADGEWAHVSDILAKDDGSAATETRDAFEPQELAARVPKRRFPGPVNEQSLARHHSPELLNQLFELQGKYGDLPRVLPALALYWTDGKRTLSEIVQRVALETGVRAPQAIAEYFQILAELGAIHWQGR